MNSNGGPKASSRKGDMRTLRVETGECVVLSPQSDRFREHYRRVQPRTATEVRNLIGLSDEMARSLRERGVCCQQHDRPVGFPAPNELDSEDELVRGRAFDNVAKGLYSFICSTTPELMAPIEPAIERFLEITKLELNLVSLQDIEVADGATLTVSDDTHLIEANKIIIHGDGQLKCNGFTKMNVNSIEGT